MATGSYIVRLGVKDDEVVRRALTNLGNDGEKALRRLDRAARVPAGGFNVLKGATRQLDSQLAGLSARTGSLSGVFAALGPAGIAAGAAVGGAMLGLGAAMDRARTAIDKLDKLDDTAIKLGVTAEGLQALRFAFQQNGVAAEITDAAIEKLNDCIGQMANLGDKAPQTVRRAFAQLGIEVRDTYGPGQDRRGGAGRDGRRHRRGRQPGRAGAARPRPDGPRRRRAPAAAAAGHAQPQRDEGRRARPRRRHRRASGQERVG